MAYFVTKRDGSWEARESVRTDSGPRSRSLASFRDLTPHVIEQMVQRATRPLDLDELRLRAVRVGIPVLDEADRLAARLAREVARGNRPSRRLSVLLGHALSNDPMLPEHLQRMSMWVGSSPRERADALVDLLRASAAFPPRVRDEGERPVFPRIESSR